MDKNIKTLLDKINIDMDSYQYFNDAVVKRIVVNSKRDIWKFYIEMNSLLPVNVLEELDSKRLNLDSSIKDVLFNFKVENTDLNTYIDYYPYVLNKLKDELKVLEIYKDALRVEDGYLILIVSNKVEEVRLGSCLDKLNDIYKSLGYPFNINIVLRHESSIAEEIKKDLESVSHDIKINNNSNSNNSSTVSNNSGEKLSNESDSPKKVYKKREPKDPNSVMGRGISEDPIKIKSIVGEDNNVVVEAKIFGVDFFESSKSDFKIITLKITDGSDSIYCKVFVRDPEEYSRLSKELKSGKWFKFRGYTKNDPFSKELVLNARDILKIEKEENVIVDNAEVKRVELHAHTMMSGMDGITKLDLGKHTSELVERTIKMGYRGVAITDHSGCQAFPISFAIINSHNKDVRKKINSEIDAINERMESGDEDIDYLQNELFKLEEKRKNPPIFKGLYGTELTLVDDTVNIVVRPTDLDLLSSTYVVFDTETTGFNAGGADQMIEIGAVKLKDGAIIDRFDELIDPGRHIPDKITELTQITDDMVKGCPNEEEVTKKFIEWAGDCPMVAHNAKFDISFVSMAMKKYELGEFKSTVIDTLELSRTLDQGYARHSLSALVKRYNVPWEEDAHHRADYDAEGTANVFYKMLKKLENQHYEKISDLDNLVSKDEIYKFGRTYHFNAIAQTQQGLKNLFKIISLANTVYLYKTPRILRSKLEELRDGILIGSGCYESEVFLEARSKEGQELTNIINFYDYVEVQPPEVYDHLLQLGDFKDLNELQNHIKKIIDATMAAGKIMVATGDVHHFTRDDKIYREIIVNQKVPGGGRHPLARKGITSIPSQHFRTTEEMLDNFSFLDKDLAYKIVVENTNKLLDMVEQIQVIPDTGGIPFSPRVKSDDGSCYLDCPRVVTDLVYTKAKDWYGEPLPFMIEQRIATELYGDIVFNTVKENLKDENLSDSELEIKANKMLHDVILEGFDSVKKLVGDRLALDNPDLEGETLEKELKKKLGGIIGGGFDPIYLIAQRLVKHSNDEGYLVGSRGSVGSSFVATMMGITEVNPLAAHYRCNECKTSIFEDDDGTPFGANYSSGFDLPDKECPNCHIPMIKDGQDMPFATFLGFNADKVPDIDLNFSDLNQASAHAYTKVLFGADNVYRAGTIGTVAEKTAFGYVKGYLEEHGISEMRNAEVERLAMGCTGVKRTTGQHPGGIVVIPDYMSCFDFTPFQFPAEDPNAEWRTTHFDYHSIDECVLKLDILGHSDPTQLRLIQLQSNTDIMKVPLDDKDTMSIFTSTEALGVTKEQIMCNTGTLGIPEFGTAFTIKLVEDTKPKTFGELIKISGLSHGTDVWLGNAQELIANNVVPFKDTIGCRDDIMVYLMYNGLEPIKAFKIMEFVRKGKASKDPETWKKHVETMKNANIPEWFIGSCAKIKYMFPKAHAAAYVISAFRIAWYKVHMPVYFYASWLSSKATDVDVVAMIGGYDTIKNRIIEIQDKGYDATNKESGQAESLKVCLEATARGIKFLNVDLYKSDATVWTVNSDNEIYPPFNSIDGLGDTVAKNLVKEREIKPFLSLEDVQKRGKVSQSLIDRKEDMGVLKDLPDSNQLSLF